jgi:hypothetical protein
VNPDSTVIEAFGRAFPECLRAYRELQRLDNDFEDLMYVFSAQVLMPDLVRPLMEMADPDPLRMRPLFDVVEELAASEDVSILTFIRSEICESFAHGEWYEKSRAFMGDATKLLCAGWPEGQRELRHDQELRRRSTEREMLP